jgi:hypothetical protein
MVYACFIAVLLAGVCVVMITDPSEEWIFYFELVVLTIGGTIAVLVEFLQ